MSTSCNVIMKMPQSTTFTIAALVGKDDKYEKKVTPSPAFPLMTGPGGEHDNEDDLEEENNSRDDSNVVNNDQE